MGPKPINASLSSSLLGPNVLTIKQKAPKGAFFSDPTLKNKLLTDQFKEPISNKKIFIIY